jgi:hypothetical protein
MPPPPMLLVATEPSVATEAEGMPPLASLACRTVYSLILSCRLVALLLLAVRLLLSISFRVNLAHFLGLRIMGKLASLCGLSIFLVSIHTMRDSKSGFARSRSPRLVAVVISL